MDPDPRLQEVAGALADPLRMAVLEHLIGGPATVSEIVALTGQSQSKVSNHLALLRERGLVHSTRQGRQRVYELRDPSVGQLVESLLTVAGASHSRNERKSASMMTARTCYDHLAGNLGVSLFDSLVEYNAIGEPGEPKATVELGPSAEEVFGDLFNIDLQELSRERRRFAFACMDWTERKPHLGGALGAALWATLVERGWVVSKQGSREVILTDEGKRELHQMLDVELGEEGS